MPRSSAKAILRRPATLSAAATHLYPSAGTIRVSVAVNIPDILRTFGKDPEPIVARAGLSLDLLANGDNVIPYAALDRLIAQGVREAAIRF